MAKPQKFTFFVYLAEVLKESWSESLDAAQATVFVAVILLGAVIAMFPVFAASHSLPDFLNGVLSWKGAALALLAVVFARIFVAPYNLALRDKVEIVNANEKINSLQKIIDVKIPKLETRIDQCMTGKKTDSDLGSSSIILLVTVFNIGEVPTIIRDFQISIEFSGFLIYPILTELQNITLPIDQSKKRFVTYKNTDHLHKKGSSPIPPGGMVQGLILGKIPDSESSQFESFFGAAGISYSLKYKDVKGNDHSYSWLSTGEISGLAALGQINPDVS